MKILRRKHSSEIMECDMTPMIDIVFQLIAFFMFLINFTQAEQDDRITLPESALAKPPEKKVEQPITLQLKKDGTVLIGGDEVEIGPALDGIMAREYRALGHLDRDPGEVPIIIRADRNIATGKVQEAIEICQKYKFVQFKLRVKEDLKS